MALDMGIVPAEVQQGCSGRSDWRHSDARQSRQCGDSLAGCGVSGALGFARRDDVIFDVATQTTNPSYGYQVVNGATGLTELWDGAATGLGSQNHMMLGAIDEWFTAIPDWRAYGRRPALGGLRVARDPTGGGRGFESRLRKLPDAQWPGGRSEWTSGERWTADVSGHNPGEYCGSCPFTRGWLGQITGLGRAGFAIEIRSYSPVLSPVLFLSRL